MSKRFVLGLLGLALALIAYIALFERDSLSSKELDERKGRVLSTFVRDHLTQLSLTRDGKGLVLARKLDDDGTFSPWKLTSPLSAEADQDSVDRLLGELEWLSARRILEHVKSTELEQFGLAKPRFRVGYRASNEDYAFNVGGGDATGDNYYLAYSGEDTVYVVPKTVVEALDHDLGHFRAKEFLGDITSAWAERLTLSSGAQQPVVLQKESERWHVLSAPKSFADARRVKELIDKLDGLRAVRFLDGEAMSAAQKDLANAQHTVQLRVVPDVHREDKTPQLFVLRLGGDCAGHDGERYAQSGERGDPVCVRAEDVARFAASAEELRLARLYEPEPSEIESLELSAGDQHWKLKRDGEKWQAEGLPAPDREAVEAWLRDLHDSKALGFVSTKLSAPRLTLKVSRATPPEELVSVEVTDGKELLVQRAGEAVALRFPASLWERLRPFPGRFAPLSLWPGKQPSQVVALSARAEGKARKLVLDEQAFRVRKGAPPVADAERVRDLVRALIRESAISSISDQARAEQGLDNAWAGVTFSLSGDAGAPATLELGAKSERGLFARVDGTRIVEVDASLAKIVRELASGEQEKVVEPDAGAEEEESDHEHEHDHEH